MKQQPIADSELIINSDGSIFHIHIKPGQLADRVILVGDPRRVALIKTFFDHVESEAACREFISFTGSYKGKRITVLSTGIGTDNIDIVMTELDALANVDFETRMPKEKHTSLDIVRIGSSGSLQRDVDINTWLLSESAIGFDGLLNFYEGRDDVADLEFEKAFEEFTNWNPLLAKPYVVSGSREVIDRLKNNNKIVLGTTISAPGFYGPQGRIVRLPLADPEINNKISAFRFGNRRITNYEMECSAIFGLSALLGHRAATVCVIIANRLAGKASPNYRSEIMNLICHILENF